MNYEWQCRHYMAVKNLDTAYCACLFGNSENDFVFRRIDRDLDFEENSDFTGGIFLDGVCGTQN